MLKRIVSCLIAAVLFIFCLPMLVLAEETTENETESTAKAYILMEANTRQEIQGQNEESQLPVAGLTKVMSYLLFFEALEKGTIKNTDMVPVSKEAASKGGTRVFLDSGAQYSVETLLKPAIMCSANDAVCALAEKIAGTEAAFTDMMNTRAKELGLGCTFADATGLSPDSTMSARDLGIIASELSQYSGFFKYSSLWLDTFTHESGRTTEMANSNKLVKVQGFDGMATGSTAQSGYSLVATLKNGSARFICVVIGDQKTDSRFTFAKNSINYAAATYTVKQIAKAGGKVKTVPLAGGGNTAVDLFAKEDLSILLKKGEEAGLEKKVEVNEILPPIAKGTVVGRIIVKTADGAEYSVALAPNADIEELTFSSCLHKILQKWLG